MYRWYFIIGRFTTPSNYFHRFVSDNFSPIILQNHRPRSTFPAFLAEYKNRINTTRIKTRIQREAHLSLSTSCGWNNAVIVVKIDEDPSEWAGRPRIRSPPNKIWILRRLPLDSIWHEDNRGWLPPWRIIDFLLDPSLVLYSSPWIPSGTLFPPTRG